MPQQDNLSIWSKIVLLALLVYSLGALYVAVTSSLDKKTEEPLAPTIATAIAEAKSGDLLGSGTVKSVDRSDTKLRDAGFEKVRVSIEAGAKTRQRDWEIVSPISENYQNGDVVQLWVTDHKNHNSSSDHMFFFLCRQPSEVK